MALQNILLHPRAFKIRLNFNRLYHLPTIGNSLELVGYNSEYIVLAPMLTDIRLIGRVLLPDKEEAQLSCHFGHSVGILLLDAFQGTGYGIGTAPGLYPHRAIVAPVEQYFFYST